MKGPEDIMSEGAETFAERKKTYGENWRLVGPTMKALFPNGVALSSSEDHNRFHIFMLIVVKLSRYVQNWSAGGHEDSIHDAMVYCAMLEAIDSEIKNG